MRCLNSLQDFATARVRPSPQEPSDAAWAQRRRRLSSALADHLGERLDADRKADLSRTLDALPTGASGWPTGLIDSAVTRLETLIEVLWMSDEELGDMSARYTEFAGRTLGPTSAALMIEIARRSTLTAHERIAEMAERADGR